MNMFTFKDKLLVGGGFVFVVLLILVGLFFTPGVSAPSETEDNREPPPPIINARVLFVEPLQDQRDISVAPAPNVTFSESVTGKKVQLRAVPKINFSTTFSSNGEKVIFSPKSNLKPKTNYTFQVTIEDESIFSWNVVTGSSSTSQGNLASVANKIRKELPLSNNDYGISYDGATDQFFVFIAKGPIEVTKEKANQWLRSQGLKDFRALNINYSASGSLLR